MSQRQAGANDTLDDEDVAAALRAPRFAFGWAALVYAFCTLSLGYPALAGRFLVNPHSDQYIAGYAFREFAASTLRATGSFPMWDPYLYGGMPYVAAMHGDIFYPTFLLRMVMPTDIAMTWGFIIHIFLSGLFTYGFLRAIGYSFAGALIGGIAYMMGGQIASYVSPGHDGKLFVSALFPLALWMLHRGFRDSRAWAWGAFALIVGLAVLSPHPQLLQYMLLASGAYSLFLAFATIDGVRLERNEAIRKLAFALGAVVLGLVIGAVQYLPVREYVQWSPRSGGLANYETATSYAWPPEELLNVYLPQFSGMLSHYWGRNRIHLHSDYVGVVVLMLAGAGFYGLRADTKKKQIVFWSVALVISILWSVGSSTPFYRIPYAILPGTKYFRAPATIFFIGAFAIALLACAGAEKVLRGVVSRRYWLGWLIFGGIIAVLASLGGLTSFAESFADPRQVDILIANSRSLFLGSWRSLLFLALVFVLVYGYQQGKITARNTVLGLAALMIIDLWSIEHFYWMFSARATSLYASDAVTQTIQADPQPARVLAVAFREPPGPDPFLNGDALMSHRIRTVLGYHGNEIGRYDNLTNIYGQDDRLFTRNVLQLTNTRFLLTNIPELPFIGNTTLIKGPVRNAAGDTTWLFRFNAENPYAWVTPVSVKAADDRVLATLLNPRFEVTRAALFDTSAKVRAATAVDSLPPALSLTTSVRRYEPGHVVIDLNSPAPTGSALVVSENYYPGWKATADGKPAAIGRVDYTFIGVDLPAGAKSVELWFTSPAYETGKVVTWLAIALGLLLLAGGVWRDRRRFA